MELYEIRMTMYLTVEADSKEEAIKIAEEEYGDHSLEVIEKEG